MKNVMIYNKINDKPRWTDEDLFQSFRAQIDNSIERGWKREDIIIGTNFDFEYNGVKNKLLTDVCEENPFCNKFYGIYFRWSRISTMRDSPCAACITRSV